MVNGIVLGIAGVVIGWCIAKTFLFPLVDWLAERWAIRHSSPFFDDTLEERMEEVADDMLSTVRESRVNKRE